MHILSWNVNSLCTSRIVGNRAARLKREIASATSLAVDVLMLQEHKLAHPFGHLLGAGSRTYWSPSIGDSGHSCGVCISISSAFVASVCQHDILVPGRAMYVILRIADSRIGFMSIYAPTHARARSAFWSLLVDALRPLLASVDSWVVGGDFNNIESPQDFQAEVAPVLTSIAPSEQDAWDRFLLCIRAEDVWCMPSFAHQPCSLGFSWGLRRQQGRLLERLDRFYVGSWASHLGGSICIWPGTSMSDHSPVSLTVVFERPLAERRGARIPDRILSGRGLTDCITHIWGADHSL